MDDIQFEKLIEIIKDTHPDNSRMLENIEGHLSAINNRLAIIENHLANRG